MMYNKGDKFTFARLRYRSGDWDTDQRMPSNLLNSLIEYTTLPINLQEKIIDLDNHDIDGLFARSFEAQMHTLFGPTALQKIPNTHRIYNSFFKFEKGPPTTSFELNGWGDDLVHDYLKAVLIKDRIGVLYSNKDYGCEWDYDFRNKRFLAEDNTKFGVNIIMYALAP